MALSPKQIATRAIFKNLQQFIDAAKASTPDFAEGRSSVIKAEKAREMVDNVCRPFVQKIEKLVKRKLGKSVAEEIDAADEKDNADF
jgi:hypothetical protein